LAIAELDIKKLWGLAAGRCSNPDCGIECIKFFVAGPTIIGEMAHVIARQPKGRRGIAGGGSNAYENLILLCPTHHTEVDKAPEGAFSVEILHQWKDAHEQRIRDSLSGKNYLTRAELFREIHLLLIDNYEIWHSYGPLSDEAQRNPLSNVSIIWALRKVSHIVPNNEKICCAINGSQSLLTAGEYRIAIRFKEYAAAFSSHCIHPIDGYPTFPQSFLEMVEKNDKWPQQLEC
jgi:hypothetical protein